MKLHNFLPPAQRAPFVFDCIDSTWLKMRQLQTAVR
jgi:hypothetical protein